MQMFLAAALQRSSDARGLGIRFVALAPSELLAGTAIGEAAAIAYDTHAGPLDPVGVARAIVAIASGEAHPEATQLSVTNRGIEVVG
jgi:hypothetical protein